MKYSFRIFIYIINVVSLISALQIAASEITKTEITRTGNRITISFSVSEPTDIEAGVINKEGKTVRHLAAGVIGRGGPVQPLKKGLSQKIIWNGRDDFGRMVLGIYKEPSLSVRIRSGMKAELDGFVGEDPYMFGSVRGMAVDPKGDLYVMELSYANRSRGPFNIRVFKRNGEYARTILPYPADMKPSELKGIPHIINDKGLPVPLNYAGIWPHLYPYSVQGYKLSSSVINGSILVFHDDWYRRLFLVNTEDGAPVKGKFSIPLWNIKRDIASWDHAGSPLCAASPDGSVVYASGYDAKKKPAQFETVFKDGRIHKFTFGPDGIKGENFITLDLPEGYKGPQGGWTINQAAGAVRGMAVDAKGNLYVCDGANGKFRKFNADGKEQGALDIPGIAQVAVHPDTGALYILTCPKVGYECPKKLIKFDAFSPDKKSKELDLGKQAAAPFLAVDFKADPVQIWAAVDKLLRIQETDKGFTIAEDLRQRADHDKGIPAVDKMSVDYETGDLYINNGWNRLYKFSGTTGKYTGHVKDGKQNPLVVTDAAVSPDGYTYVQRGPSYSGPFEKLDRNLKPVPLPGHGKSIFANIYGRYGAGYCEKGHCIDYNGTIYSLSMYNWAKYFVCAWDRFGKAVQGLYLINQIKAPEPAGTGIHSAIIGPLHGRCGGIKVDRKGHLYIGLQEFPLDFKPPKGFEKDPGYKALIGSIFKFSLNGGGMAPKGKGKQYSSSWYHGVEKVYPGFGAFSGNAFSQDTGFHPTCVCRSPRFDLDPFGRLFIPNAVTFSVKVVDNNSNEILRFGSYGNYDSQGDKSKVPVPDIPMAWPLSVGVSEKHIYVGDLINQRVVRVNKKYEAEKIMNIPELPKEAENILALAKKGSGKDAGAAWKGISHKDLIIRLAGIKAYGLLADQKGIGKILGLLIKSDDQQEREACKDAVISIVNRTDGRKACIDGIKRLYKKAPSAARITILQIMGHVRGQEALSMGEKGLKDESAEVKDAACAILCSWKEPAALDVLLRMMKDPGLKKYALQAFQGYLSLLSGMKNLDSAKKLKRFAEVIDQAPESLDRGKIFDYLMRELRPETLAMLETYFPDKKLGPAAGMTAVIIGERIWKKNWKQVLAVLKVLQKKVKNEAVAKRAAALKKAIMNSPIIAPTAPPVDIKEPDDKLPDDIEDLDEPGEDEDEGDLDL